MTRLKPLEGYALVAITNPYEGLAELQDNFNRATQGILIECAELKKYEGSMVYWEEFRASEIVEHEGKKYSFVKVEDLRGAEIETGQTTN